MSSNFSEICWSFHPPDIDSEDDSLYEQKKSLKSASSSSSLKKSSIDYSKVESKTKSANPRSKKKSTNIDKTNKQKSFKSTKSKSLQKNSASNSLVSINKLDNTQSTCNKLDHVRSRINAQLSQIRTGQKYYINHEVPDINQNYAHNVQSLSKVNHFDSLFGEKIYSNYNPSTVYRLKKLQAAIPELFNNRRRTSTNLIATLETDTDYDKPLKKSKNDGANQTKCAHCLTNEKSQSANKSPTNTCSCSEVEFDTSEISFNEHRKQTIPVIAQRVKSVSIVRNKNIEFFQGANSKFNEMKIQTHQTQPILKIHKYGSNSNLAALKQYSSTSINKKTNRSNSNHNGECESRITVAKNLVNKNNIELELVGTDLENSFSSSRSRANPSPCGNYNKNYHFKKVISGSNSNTPSNNNSIKHHRDIYLQKKYPEAISISGKSFLAGDGNLNYDNKHVRIL